ncbi:MAG TPA: PAS domain S-box protein [Anaerolineales bacterium]|nr:PAS domain S-box protein [Anaerolineales bacterium]
MKQDPLNQQLEKVPNDPGEVSHTLEHMFSSSIAAIMFLQSIRDEQGNIVDFLIQAANHAAVQILNLGSVEAVSGKRFLELFPRVTDVLFDMYVKAVETGEPQRMEQHYNYDLYDNWCDLTAVKNGDGFIMTFHDITAQKKAERELQQSRDLLQLVLDTSPNSITAYKPLRDGDHNIEDFEVAFVNAFTVRTTGGVDPTGHRLTHMFPTAKANGFFDRLRHTMETGETQDFELWYEGEGMRNWFHMITVRMEEMVLVTTEDITARKQAEQEALGLRDELAKRAEDKYEALFNSIDQGFCTIEVRYDEHNKPVDYRFLEVSPSFAHQTGIQNGAGKWMKEIAPDQDKFWFETYGRIALTRKPERFEYFSTPLGKWWSVYAFPAQEPERRRIGVLFNDITERKLAEAALRESEEHKAYVLKLSDALRQPVDPVELQETASRVLGEHLGVSRVMYAEVSDDGMDLIIERNYITGNVPILTGRYQMADFGRELLAALTAGRTIIVPDVASAAELSLAERAAFAGLGVAALAGVPLIKHGRFVGKLSVHHSTPRTWSQNEIKLIEETAERTWDAVQRAKAEAALRESEARIQKALSTETVGVLFFRLDGRITEANESFLEMSGYSLEELLSLKDWALLTPPEFMAVNSRAARDLAEAGETAPYEKQMTRKDGSRWWGLFAPTRLSGHGLESECVEFIIDITKRKQIEEALRDQQATLQGFYDSAPFLMGIAELNGDQIVAISGNRAAAEFFATDPLALPGKTGTGLGNSEDFERLWTEQYRRSQREGKPVQFDYEHLRFTGSRWLRATVAFIGMGPSGNPRYSFVVEDITERKRAALALREHQKQLQLLNETLEQRVHEKTTEVRHLASDLIKATQRERQRISHVLHDDLQQRIYAIQMQLSFLRDGLQSLNDPADREISDIEKELRDILEITRHLSIDLSPPILHGEGLSHAIDWLAGRMQQQYGLPIELQADGSFVIPDEDLHVLLFNCVRELLFNVVKHAEASRAVVGLQWTDSVLRIEVRDDGKGFPAHTPQAGSSEVGLQPSLGLPTIRHQLSLFGGRTEIYSEPGMGTQIILYIPLSEVG